MFSKKLRGALIAGATVAASVGATGVASAEVDVLESRDVNINIANDLCALPWFWQGPINTLLGSQDGDYAACNGDSQSYDTEGVDINIANNLCALPWFWQGPINFAVGEQDGSYSACN